MHLDAADSCYKNVTERQLRQVVQDDRIRGEYVILRGEPEVFAQAAGEGDGPYILEYRDRSEEHHFRSKSDEYHFHAEGEFDKATIEQAFIWYFNGDPRWKTQFTWKALPKKPWWKIW